MRVPYITLKNLVLINELSAIKFICTQFHVSDTCADLEKNSRGGGGPRDHYVCWGVGVDPRPIFDDFNM